jgi:hypothetical protein
LGIVERKMYSLGGKLRGMARKSGCAGGAAIL